MTPEEFRRILSAFADSPADYDFARGRLLVQLRDELLEATVRQHEGDLWIQEQDESERAVSWLIRRVARLPSLADRILDYVPAPEHFVAPEASLVDQPDFQASSEPVGVSNAVITIQDLLARPSAGSTSILYITSDAGEGKTTIINYLARAQAKRYRDKTSDFLIVPIPLGGRAFLRFDDVVVAALVNKLRYQLLYFDGFLELVKLGVIVPALDGFEEMFVEGSSGEAISALGNLVRSLNSSGAVLLAARKAYFEYRGLGAQARLLDGLGGSAVAFSRVGLRRWSRERFMQYASLRELSGASQLYDAVETRLGAAHPLLTRAVLVRRLVDVGATAASVGEFVEKLGRTPQDYFYQFVGTLIEREATVKWIDRSGEPLSPLLTVDEHHDLLALVAQEMWLASSDSLRGEVLDLVADLYCEATKRSPIVSRQVRERLRQHSLLINADGGRGVYTFDHEDFRHFYLGEALGRVLAKRDEGELRRILRVGGIVVETAEAAMHYVERTGQSPREVLSLLERLARQESTASYTRENAGLLALRALQYPSTDIGAKPVVLHELMFPAGSLVGQTLNGVEFESCYFQPTSLESANLVQCHFHACRLERLELYPTTSITTCAMQKCEIGSVVLAEGDEELFEPLAIWAHLAAVGFQVVGEPTGAQAPQVDENIRLTERALRVFRRANQVNDVVWQQRLRTQASSFFSTVLPELVGAGVITQVQYRGAGNHRRYSLTRRMEDIQEALRKSGGSFERFIRNMRD